MAEAIIEARVEKGKRIPLKPLSISEGAIVKIKIEEIEDRRKAFLEALKKTAGIIRGGKTKREDWYEQAYFY